MSGMAGPVTRFDLLRHGEPHGGRMYRGQRDDPLSESGWRQMRDSAASQTNWIAVVSSPLRRCADFARELASQRNLPLLLDTRLQEMGLGAWEGRSPAELARDEPDRLRRYRRDPYSVPPPGAEPLADFQTRVDAAWADLCRDYRNGEHLLIVAHAGVIRAIIVRVLGMPPEHLFHLRVDYAHLTRIHIDADGAAQLVFHNCGVGVGQG